MALDYAPFIPISEIQRTDKCLVRTVGYARQLDAANQLLSLEYNGSTCTIDIQYIHPFLYRPGLVYQFIGELLTRDEGSSTVTRNVVLKAHLYREMTGLDIELYYHVQSLRKQS